MDRSRNPNDDREAPICRRCGAAVEPDDFLCWRCGGEEVVLSGEVVPHVYINPHGPKPVRKALDGLGCPAHEETEVAWRSP